MFSLEEQVTLSEGGRFALGCSVPLFFALPPKCASPFGSRLFSSSSASLPDEIRQAGRRHRCFLHGRSAVGPP